MVYGYFNECDAGLTRLRVSVDECDRLGLAEGRRVRVRLPGRGSADVLVAEVRRVPPFVWLDLRPLA